MPLPARTTARRTTLSPLRPLLLRIQHQAEHIETELWELQAHSLELLLCLVTKDVRARSPECRDRLANVLVVDGSLLVDESRVCNLALGCTLREVNLAVCHGGQCRKLKLLRKSVDARMAEEANTFVVWLWDGRVVFQVGVAGEGGEVVAFVEVFDHGGCGGHIIACEVDATARIAGELLNGAGEEGGLGEEALVGVEGVGVVAVAYN